MDKKAVIGTFSVGSSPAVAAFGVAPLPKPSTAPWGIFHKIQIFHFIAEFTKFLR